MKDVTFRLIDQTGDEKFELGMPSNDVVTDQRLAWQYFHDHVPVAGLRAGLTGSGMITLKADADQLTPSMIDTIRNFVEAALQYAKERSGGE